MTGNEVFREYNRGKYQPRLGDRTCSFVLDYLFEPVEMNFKKLINTVQEAELIVKDFNCSGVRISASTCR